MRRNSIYRVQFDGSITDHDGFCVIGGDAEDLQSHLQTNFREGAPLGDTVRLGRTTLERASNGGNRVPIENLEVCLLERVRTGRKFRRLSAR